MDSNVDRFWEKKSDKTDNSDKTQCDEIWDYNIDFAEYLDNEEIDRITKINDMSSWCPKCNLKYFWCFEQSFVFCPYCGNKLKTKADRVIDGLNNLKAYLQSDEIPSEALCIIIDEAINYIVKTEEKVTRFSNMK